MNPKRFTLIELLVVIAIIAIVVASKVRFFLQFLFSRLYEEREVTIEI